MADAAKQEHHAGRESGADADQPAQGKLARLADRFLTRKWIGILLGVSLAVDAVGFSYYQLRIQRGGNVPEAEVSLGDFQFTALEPGPGQVAEASFALHLALIDEVSRPARQRLRARTFRVQQDIEQLLRRAHSSDFDDPLLAELKRQLQEQIDRALELRAIAEVIITDLRLDRIPGEAAPITETVGAVPWVESPAG